MNILDFIDNRTENWKTARSFAHLLVDSHDRVELARKLGEEPNTSRGDIGVQLFWKGMRDYLHKTGLSKEEIRQKCTESYRELFSDLRSEITEFSLKPSTQSLEELKGHNYSVTQDTVDGLLSNLRNTEIDIVLESPNRLFIGEAKVETGLRGIGSYVLVHQLIRQYVTASILLHIMGSQKNVVPFLVVDKDKRERVLQVGQVRFMVEEKQWLDEGNVLTWDFFERLHP